MRDQILLIYDIDGMRRIFVIFIALFLDATLGDPPNRWHPVAWMGQFIALGQRRAPESQSSFRSFLYGLGIMWVGCVTLWGLGASLVRLFQSMPSFWGMVVEGIVLKTTFSLRGLSRAAAQIEQALTRDALPAARHWLAWHLVSRDTQRLNESEVAAATIESIAENASDGVIAPLFYYTLGGLPAALVYRFCNTADAMLGYRDPAREWLGKAPARMDDVANFIPARMTAIALIAGAFLFRGDADRAWRIWRRDARRTASPNAGHPMSSMSGALGVRLEKSGSYVLGEGLRPPHASDILVAIQLLYQGVMIAVAGFSVWRLLFPQQD